MNDEASPPVVKEEDHAPPPPRKEQLLVIATRIHRGESSTTTMEDADHIQQQIQQFCRFCQASHRDINDPDAASTSRTSTVVRGVIAVDVTTPNEDLLAIVRAAVGPSVGPVVEIHVLPVQPWGTFTPALNALLSDAAQALRRLAAAAASRPSVVVVGGAILYCSLETTTSSSSSRAVRTLFQYMDYETTLVCGAVLPGHEHTPTTGSTPTTILNGRTSPWNTFALWNVNKLSKIGFVTVSEGLTVDLANHDTTTKSIAGIEEVATIALLQQLFNPHTEMMAKLISVGPVVWDTTTTDPARQQWHDYKMQSKVQRAREQLRFLSLLPDDIEEEEGSDQKNEPRSESSSRPGIVYHY